MAPERKALWQQLLTIISIVAFLVGIGMAWQSAQSAISAHDEKIKAIEDVQRTQWRQLNSGERKLDEISINLRVLMRQQNLEYQRVVE